MTALPRRSARLQQQQQYHTSSYSSLSSTSSTSTTSHPSPTNTTIAIPAQPQQYSFQLQAQFFNPAANFAAPLPSPSASEVEPFFGRPNFAFQYNSGIMSGEGQNNQNMQHNHIQNGGGGGGLEQPQQQQQQQMQGHSHHHHHHHHHNSFSSQSQQRPVFNNAEKNAQPPPDFLAEAAKRAQMACLMRDLGDVSL